MKKTFHTVLSVLLTACVIISLSSCSLFATMREYSKKASEIEILPTPEDEALFAEFNKAIGTSAAEAVKMSASVSYNVKNIDVTNADDTAGLLDKAAGTISKLILANKPGAQSNETEPADLTGTLLENFDAASSLSYNVSRNTVNVAVTDAKGEEATDEEGAVIRETQIKDNFAVFDFLFYNDTVVEEAHTDAEGNDVAEVTERTFADDAAIEAVFGTAADKQTVLAAFDTVKDYFTVNDYSFTYDTCKVSADTDLDSGRINSVNFEKVMKVTASVTGQGAFADYGELTVTFDVIRTDGYAFTYAPAEE